MTEQIEDEFWAQARAEDAAARGQQADPSACGTCRGLVAEGKQVEHDECAQRAILLPAPDTPGYELLTGLTEEELAALPPRFHVPAYMESSTPQMWVCAVCWGDGWVTQWPCKTAVKHGLRVFTPEHDAETAAKRQAARITELEKQLAEYEPLNPQQCPKGLHADWLVDSEYTHACPWCRITELEGELAKYVGAEPTVAEEMAYLSRCFHAVHDVCDETERQATRWENPLPVPEWVEQVRKAASGEGPEASARPAIGWAFTLDEAQRHELLSELSTALLGYWHSDPDTDVLARVEAVLREQRANAHGIEVDANQLPDVTALRQALRVRNAQLARLRTEMTGGAR